MGPGRETCPAPGAPPPCPSGASCNLSSAPHLRPLFAGGFFRPLPPTLSLSGGSLEVYTAVNCCSSVSSSILKGRGSTSEATGCPRVRRPLLSNGPGGVTWYTAGKQAWNIPQKWLGQSRCPNASRSLSSWELGFNEKTVNTELQAKWASLVAQMVKDPPAMWKTQV